MTTSKAKADAEKKDKTESTVDDLPDTVPVYNVNDGIHGRQGGPYLDEELLRRQEELAARAEGREVDYTNIGGSTGVQLVTGEELLRVHASTLPVGTGVPEITAPVYGYIPNPAKARAKAEQEDLDAAVKRAEAGGENGPSVDDTQTSDSVVPDNNPFDDPNAK